MKIPASFPFASATALGVALMAGVAFAPPLAAQEQTATDLDRMEEQIDPPPPIDTDSQAALDAERADTGWKQLDSDGDGRISRNEGSVDPDFDRNFEMMDTDSDGYVTGSEMDGHDPTDVPEPEEDDGQR